MTKPFQKHILIPLAAALFICGAIPFHAQALTVAPARLEIVGDPGKVTTSEIELFNEQTTGSTFYFSAANFEAQGEGGVPNFVDATEGLATWITTPESVVLKAGEQKKIPISINVPAGTQPGGYFAGVFLSTTPTKTKGGGEVSIGAKVGVLVLFRVSGEVKEGGDVLDFTTRDDKKFFTALPVGFTYRFKNGGSDRVMPNGTITMKHVLGWTSAKIPANAEQGNVLPFGSVRKFNAQWGEGAGLDPEETGFFDRVGYEWHHFALGRYTAKLALTYGDQGKTAKGVTHFWVIPWHLLLSILVVLTLVWLILRYAFRKYNHYVIVQAEEMLEHEHGFDHPEPREESPAPRATHHKNVTVKTESSPAPARKKAKAKRAIMND